MHEAVVFSQPLDLLVIIILHHCFQTAVISGSGLKVGMVSQKFSPRKKKFPFRTMTPCTEAGSHGLIHCLHCSPRGLQCVERKKTFNPKQYTAKTSICSSKCSPSSLCCLPTLSRAAHRPYFFLKRVMRDVYILFAK